VTARDGQARIAMAGCVLAGGRSTRMGTDKAALVVAGTTLAARAVGRLEALFERVLVSANEVGPFATLGAPIFKDALGGEGPLAGIATALAEARDERVFVCAVDLPFVAEPLVRWMCEVAGEFDVVVPARPSTPRSPGSRSAQGERTRLEPLCAVYSRRCLPHFRARLAAGEYGVEAAILDPAAGLRVRVVEPAEVERHDARARSFRNVNTPEDYRRVVAEIAAHPWDHRRTTRQESDGRAE
jgi:molybdopterin-guanine dinucleotide biosynthesis protein A